MSKNEKGRMSKMKKTKVWSCNSLVKCKTEYILLPGSSRTICLLMLYSRQDVNGHVAMVSESCAS